METLEKYRVGAGSETFISEMGKEIGVHVVYFPMYQMKNIIATKSNEKETNKVKNDNKV